MSETKMYSVLDKWTDLDTENIVDFTSVDGVVTEARLNGVPVGGGEVTTRTITGTLADPFGDLDRYDIGNKLRNGSAYGNIIIDFSVLQPGVSFQVCLDCNYDTGYDPYIAAHYANITSEGVALALESIWDVSPDLPTLREAFGYFTGQVLDLSPYASNIPTTLTLYEVD